MTTRGHSDAWCATQSVPRNLVNQSSADVVAYKRDQSNGGMERKVVRPEDPSWVRPVYDGGLSFGQNVRSATFGMSARDGRADVTTLARSGKLPDSRKLEAEHIDRPAPWVDDLMWRRRVGLEKKYTARTIQQARHGFPTARPGSATCIPGSARSSAAAPEDQLDERPGTASSTRSARGKDRSARSDATTSRQRSARHHLLTARLEDELEREKRRRRHAEEELVVLKQALQGARLEDVVEEGARRQHGRPPSAPSQTARLEKAPTAMNKSRTRQHMGICFMD